MRKGAPIATTRSATRTFSPSMTTTPSGRAAVIRGSPDSSCLAVIAARKVLLLLCSCHELVHLAQVVGHERDVGGLDRDGAAGCRPQSAVLRGGPRGSCRRLPRVGQGGGTGPAFSAVSMIGRPRGDRKS